MKKIYNYKITFDGKTVSKEEKDFEILRETPNYYVTVNGIWFVKEDLNNEKITKENFVEDGLNYTIAYKSFVYEDGEDKTGLKNTIKEEVKNVFRPIIEAKYEEVKKMESELENE